MKTPNIINKAKALVKRIRMINKMRSKKKKLKKRLS